MNRLLINSIILLLSLLTLEAQTLNKIAQYIKENYQVEYESTIKKYAVDKWSNDYAMIAYEINKQADALVQLIKSFKSENTEIAFNAIKKWSIDGYLSKNIETFKEISTFGIAELLKLHCDWSMVKYEYDKQIEAKNSL